MLLAQKTINKIDKYKKENQLLLGQYQSKIERYGRSVRRSMKQGTWGSTNIGKNIYTSGNRLNYISRAGENITSQYTSLEARRTATQSRWDLRKQLRADRITKLYDEGAVGLKSTLNKLKNRSFKDIWKSFTKNKFVRTAGSLGNIYLLASMAMPIFGAAGEFVAGLPDIAEKFVDKLNNRSLDFGGRIHQSYMNRAGITERQRALNELRTSRVNARTLIGNEASMYHG